MNVQEYKKEQYRLHREENLAYQRAYRKKMTQEAIDKRNEYTRNFHRKLRAKVILLLGGKCAVCGIDDMRCLQIDHINNDGAEYRKKRKSHSSYAIFNWILKNPEEAKIIYQVLCANHNWIKKADLEEHNKDLHFIIR